MKWKTFRHFVYHVIVSKQQITQEFGVLSDKKKLVLKSLAPCTTNILHTATMVTPMMMTKKT
jgi:hypothetical protein